MYRSRFAPDPNKDRRTRSEKTLPELEEMRSEAIRNLQGFQWTSLIVLTLFGIFGWMIAPTIQNLDVVTTFATIVCGSIGFVMVINLALCFYYLSSLAKTQLEIFKRTEEPTSP